MNLRLLFLLSFTILFGCKKTSTLTFSSEVFTEKELQICEKDPCSKITIDYLKFSGEESVSEKINSEIEAFIIETLFLGEDEHPSAKTIEEASKQFIIAYRDHKNEFEYDLQYEAEITVSENFSNEALLNLQLQSYLFVGGAHGYGSTSFKNFDMLTGDEIATKDLFDDYEGFLEIAEKEFRKEFEIPQNESINATGFWFEDDIFTLPKAVGISKEEFTFIYNPYDIASYAQGQIIFYVSKKEAIPFLKKEYL